MPTDPTFASLGLEAVARGIGFARDPATKSLIDPRGERVVGVSKEAMRSLHAVLEKERPGAWRSVFKRTGLGCGKDFATALDRLLAQMQKPTLNALPLEACLAFAQRRFVAYGWGELTFDLEAAPQYGVVVARLRGSSFVEALPDAGGFVDPFVAGFLRAFFEHVTGDALGCEEVACAAAGAAECAFMLAAPDRVAKILPFIGHESADSILARLKI